MRIQLRGKSGMKMNHIKIVLLLISAIFIQSCKHSVNETSIGNTGFKYPLKAGNQWVYTASTTFKNISPDSIGYLLNDTAFTITATVQKDTVLNSIKLWKLVESGGPYAAGAKYYANENSGLMNYGYNNYPTNILPKKNSKLQLRFEGNSYDSFEQIIKTYEESLFFSKSAGDTIIYFNYPRTVFKYPINIGDEWAYSTSFVLINKKVIGKEMVSTSAGNFDCYKIQLLYPGGQLDNGEYYQYVCEKGLIKQVITFHNIEITTIQYPDGIGTADITSEWTANSINF